MQQLDRNRPVSFTVSHNGVANVLHSDAYIWEAFDPKTTVPPPVLKKFTATWDTGATNSVITQKVIDECGLKPIGMTQVNTANGSMTTPVFLASVFLPTRVCIPQLRVTQGNLLGNEQVLIGMDIIGKGDFAITNKDGKTVFPFRMPSCECIDFVKLKPFVRTTPKIGRNAQCPCGSGKKYKNCHGK
jgi:predicted aspartyl protease